MNQPCFIKRSGKFILFSMGNYRYHIDMDGVSMTFNSSLEKAIERFDRVVTMQEKFTGK